MTNWPGFALRATMGALTSISVTVGFRIRLVTIVAMLENLPFAVEANSTASFYT